jgi:hypothetical protein
MVVLLFFDIRQLSDAMHAMQSATAALRRCDGVSLQTTMKMQCGVQEVPVKWRVAKKITLREWPDPKLLELKHRPRRIIHALGASASITHRYHARPPG